MIAQMHNFFLPKMLNTHCSSLVGVSVLVQIEYLLLVSNYP
jgi:hypothetical protein